MGSGSGLFSLAGSFPTFSSLDASLSTAFSSLLALLSLLASSTFLSAEFPIVIRARVSCGRGGKKWTTADCADLGSTRDSFGTHTRSLFSPFGTANSSTRNRDNLLDSLLLEIKACSADQVIWMGISIELCLPKEIFTRWISNGGLLVVLRIERRWVDMNADCNCEGVVPLLSSFLVIGSICDSKDAICRYFPHGEKWHWTNS